MIKKNLIAPLIFSLGLGFQMNTVYADLVGVLQTINDKCAFDQLGTVNDICGIGTVGVSCQIPTNSFDNSYVQFISTTCVVTSGNVYIILDTETEVDTYTGWKIRYCIRASDLSNCLVNGVGTFRIYQRLGGENLFLGTALAAI